MREKSIHITQEFEVPVEQVFGFLGEHENLELIFKPAIVTRVRNGHSSRNGVGSVRKLKLPYSPPFYETVLEYESNRLIVYSITKGSVLKDHAGAMEFKEIEGGSRLEYTITFKGRVPFIGDAVRTGLTKSIRAGLRDLNAQLADR